MPTQLEKLIQKNQCEKGYQQGKKIHHPTPKSGVTFGPGIDVGNKTPQQIQSKYGKIVTKDQLQILKQASLLKKKQADEFCQKNKNFTLSKQSYTKLLQNQTKFCQSDVERIMTSDAMIKKYGKLGYDKNTFKRIPQKFKDVMADMRYNGRFTPATRADMIPRILSYMSAKQSGDIKMIQNTYKQVKSTFLMIYNNPNQNEIRKDPRRGKNIQNYISSNTNFENKQNIQNPQAIKNNQFYEKQQRVLQDIHKNKDQIGGIDFGFDIANYKFNGFHFGEKGFSLKNSCQQNGVSLQDIVVPLKIMNDQNLSHKNITVSLDPEVPTNPDGPYFKKVYYPGLLEGTPIGNTMIQADYLMKQLNLGVNQKNQPFKYPQSLRKIGLDFDSLAKKHPKTNNQMQRARLWIIIQDANILQSPNGTVQIIDITIGLKAKMQQIGADGKLQDCEGSISKHNQEFIKLFSKHYKILQKQYPIFKDIRKYAKATTLARLLVEKGCPINTRLIQKQFKLQIRQTTKNKPRLQHKIQTPVQNGVYIRRLSGGCDLTIQKPSLSTKIRTPLQIIDTNKIDLLNNFKLFAFQQVAKCQEPGCQNYCNIDYYSVLYKKCYHHTDMKCTRCLQYIYLAQKYQQTPDSKYHSECMACSGCQYPLREEQLKKIGIYMGNFYHQKCYPVGYCNICSNPIVYDQKYGTVDQECVHIKCFNNWKQNYTKKKMQQAPKCKTCNKHILGQYRSNGVDFWHMQCYKEPLCHICDKPNQLVMIGDSKMHLSCIKCHICKKQMDSSAKFGCIGDGKYVHVECSKK